ncbi:hypothetical protein EVAR_84704_1 [Eumeta japonica]|uniref:Uncharacterized protein n=1 Tax=Eumeta variegata TaxID=151549 RepID=A0A4C1VRR6_EUMVA|nr:hypothetical protein EVAR_84704_1 [Eumeta japonica]
MLIIRLPYLSDLMLSDDTNYEGEFRVSEGWLSPGPGRRLGDGCREQPRTRTGPGIKMPQQRTSSPSSSSTLLLFNSSQCRSQRSPQPGGGTIERPHSPINSSERLLSIL